MAVINDPNLANNIQRVGMGSGQLWVPGQVVAGPLPYGTGGPFAISMETGVLNAAINQTSELFQFRYVTLNNRVCLVHAVAVSASANVAATAAGNNALEMVVARGWTGIGSGGTRATLTGNNQKLATGAATTEVNDIGISSTSALSVGTKTLDSQAIGGVQFSPSTGALTTAPTFNLINQQTIFPFNPLLTAYPLQLANQEGFVVRVGARQMAASMTWSMRVSVIWTEVQAFSES